MAPHATKRRKLSHSSSGSEGDDAPEASLGARLPPGTLGKSGQRQGAAKSGLYRKNQANLRAQTTNGSGTPNLMNLRVEGLLTEIQLDYDKLTAKVSKFLHDLKVKIEALPDVPPRSVSDARKVLRKESKVTIPFPESQPASDTKWTLEYSRPSNINVVGSFGLRTFIKTKDVQTIDLAITMPGKIFQEKDYLNNRYFHKRAYYLACIVAGVRDLQDSGIVLNYDYLNGNVLQPIAILESQNGKDTDLSPARCRIRLLPCIAPETFPVVKTLPHKSCVRQGKESEERATEPSPFYNASLRSDASLESYLQLLHTTNKRCDSFRDACILGRVWLRQRGMASDLSRGGFGSFEWSIVCALLLQGGGPNGKPVLSPGYTSYQLFRAMLQFFSSRDLRNPLHIGPGNSELRSSDAPVLFDALRGLNVLFKVTPWSYGLLMAEARATLKALNDTIQDAFDAAFIVKTDQLMQRFDFLLRIRVEVVSNEPSECLQLCRKVYPTITRALGDRARLVHLSHPPSNAWPCRHSHTHSKHDSHILLGLVLDPSTANRLVDHGPSAEETNAATDFRDFWGEKAELRRFKDGSIVESLVWSPDSSRKPIVYQILAHALQKHHHIGEGFIHALGQSFDRFLYGDVVPAEPAPPFRALMDSFSSFNSVVRQLEGLPLSLRELSAADAQLRYASVQLPHGRPADVVIQFEGSARWPDDLTAIQRTKIAFLVKLGELLEASNASIATRLGLENERSTILNNAFLDILFSSDASFRLRIHHDREQTLLERGLRDKSLQSHSREEYAQALAIYKREFIHRPRHTQAIRTLSTRFPALSPTIRLLKRWCNAHLLGSYLPEELIELFAVRVFVHPQPWEAPSSTMTGFLRCLHMLARWNWHDEPLIVNLGGNLTAQDVTTIDTNFQAWRKIDPALNTLVLFVASDLDQEGKVWTQYSRPPKVVAGRLSALANAALDVVKVKNIQLEAADVDDTKAADTGLEQMDPGTSDFDLAEIFTSPLSHYDFLIHLHPRFTERSLAAEGESLFKNLQVQRSKHDTIGYSPLRPFLDELNATFGHSMALFYDFEEGTVIGGLWNPQSSAKRAFGLKLKYSSLPDEDTGGLEVVINRDGILAEIAMLGGDMIKQIEVHTR